MSLKGIRTAISYSLPPCQLGFCGTRKKQGIDFLKRFLLFKKPNRVFKNKASKILKTFQAAYPYYQLIANANKLKDPLSTKVVKAYWLGNNLLEKVNYQQLIKFIRQQFTKPGLLTKTEAEKRIEKIPQNAKPHHSFHVFVLGPVAARIKFTPQLLQLCKISALKVIKPKKNKLLTTKGLVDWDEKALPNIKTGDWVSVHWNQTCGKLTEKEVKNLNYYAQLHRLSEQHR